MSDKPKVLIWDWNGTLLDDTDICVEAMNQILTERHMGGITRQYYREVFTFPVQDYYRMLGFDFEKDTWNKVALEFIDIYLQKLVSCSLHQNALNIVRHFHSKNYLQVVLSAMEQNALRDSIAERGLLPYFDIVAGISNHYAAGKIDIARNLMNTIKTVPQEICLIGDSIHDHEVALALNCRCILIANGHQTHERLIKTGRVVLQELMDIKDHIR
jgi:phosphoglycolate phosphatase